MLKKILSSAVILATGVCVLTGTAHATPIPSSSTVIGPGEEKWVDGSQYMIRSDDDFDSSGSYVTMQNISERQGFTVTKAKDNSGSYSAYPYIGRGCAYGLCTAGSFPRKVSNDATPSAELSVNQNWKGAYNTSFDMWFSTYPNKDAHANGTEIMIWLSHPGISIPSSAITHRGVWVNGYEYNVMNWRARPVDGVSWNYVAFVRDSQGSYFADQYLNPFFRDAESYGLLKSSWYWTSIDAGFELCRGSGPGLQVKYFKAVS